MPSDFYRAFEDRFRGSRELVKSRLQVYLPFLWPLFSRFPEGTALDLGCGRGEWLELLRDAGMPARGVDLDEGMLASCRERGLDVLTADALATLKGLSDESQVVVSAFHLAEHLPFSYLQALVGEALRVLQPGGLLILETPNPENVLVGACSFYLDPTHRQPLPPQLLAFLPEYFGFKRTKILRLQEAPQLLDETTPLSLGDVLAGASPDFSVVAQKGGDDAILAATAPSFAKEYGLRLETLAARYEKQAQARLASALEAAERAETSARQAEVRAARAEISAKGAELNAKAAEVTAREAEVKAKAAEVTAREAEIKAKAAEVTSREAEVKAKAAEVKAREAEVNAQQAEIDAKEAEVRAREAEINAKQAEINAKDAEVKAREAEINAKQAEAASHDISKQLGAVYESTSWRVTRPVRGLKDLWSGTLPGTRGQPTGLRATLARIPGARRAYRAAKGPIQHGIRLVVSRPQLKKGMLAVITRFPALESWLRQQRAEQLRSDFANALPSGGAFVAPAATHAEFALRASPRAGQRSVDEILESIRAELGKGKGDS